jgi:transposase
MTASGHQGLSMGLSVRIFIVEDDDSIKRLPLARYERLFKEDSNERLAEYSGRRVRYALVVVDLVNRRPVEILKDEFGFLDFDDHGRLKVAELEKMQSLAFDMLDPLFADQTNSRVIDARHRFARKSYHDKFSWTPTDEVRAAIAEAIFGKFF